MAMQMKVVAYTIHNVSDLNDLVEMMRYDGFRFPATGTGYSRCGDWREVIDALAKHSAGVAESGSYSMQLWKDQTNGWAPTTKRWESFCMHIELTPAEYQPHLILN